MSIPEHVLRRLIDEAKIDPDPAAARRRARPRRCPDCGQWGIWGLDDEVAALAVFCDPVPLTPEMETVVLLAGRFTYELNHGPVLDRRDSWRIRGERSAPVVGSHTCKPYRVGFDEGLM